MAAQEQVESAVDRRCCLRRWRWRCSRSPTVAFRNGHVHLLKWHAQSSEHQITNSSLWYHRFLHSQCHAYSSWRLQIKAFCLSFTSRNRGVGSLPVLIQSQQDQAGPDLRSWWNHDPLSYCEKHEAEWTYPIFWWRFWRQKWHKLIFLERFVHAFTQVRPDS